MSVLATYIVPHPPLIIPEVGNGREKDIQNTVDSYRAVAKEIAALSPETVIIISPHAPLYADYIHISPGASASGSLSQFGAKREYTVAYDSALARTIESLCEKTGLPGGALGESDASLDHGTVIPLHFIMEHCSGFKVVRVSVSGLSRTLHYLFGMLLDKAVEVLGRRVVIVASGDLSHRLKADGPYGFAPEGPFLDAELVKIMKSGDFAALFELDPALCENAGECGLAGFVMMAGALDQRAVAPRFYSYEGPFGVGYAVAGFIAGENDPARNFAGRWQQKEDQRLKILRESESAYVRLARETLEHYVINGELPPCPENLPGEMKNGRAGVFVSIKKHGQLRGCIGTTGPTRDDIAGEIMANAVSAGTKDPRFNPVRADELPELSYSVDVLAPSEPVEDKTALDVKRYGVIVKSGRRRGLLLPNLDGVKTVDEQLSIACQKAGIRTDEDYEIERFEVVRHR